MPVRMCQMSRQKNPERLSNFGASYPEAKYMGYREKYVDLVIAWTRRSICHFLFQSQILFSVFKQNKRKAIFKG